VIIEADGRHAEMMALLARGTTAKPVLNAPSPVISVVKPA
jgi:hypothetical protein